MLEDVEKSRSLMKRTKGCSGGDRTLGYTGIDGVQIRVGAIRLEKKNLSVMETKHR